MDRPEVEPTPFPWGVYVIAGLYGLFAIVGLWMLDMTAPLLQAMGLGIAVFGLLIAYGMVWQVNWIRLFLMALLVGNLLLAIPVVLWMLSLGEFERAVKMGFHLFIHCWTWEYLHRDYVRAVFAKPSGAEAVHQDHA